MIDKRQPDLVVLDYEMPDCDGKETLELIRSKEATKDIPWLFSDQDMEMRSISVLSWIIQPKCIFPETAKGRQDPGGLRTIIINMTGCIPREEVQPFSAL